MIVSVFYFFDGRKKNKVIKQDMVGSIQQALGSYFPIVLKPKMHEGLLMSLNDDDFIHTSHNHSSISLTGKEGISYCFVNFFLGKRERILDNIQLKNFKQQDHINIGIYFEIKYNHGNLHLFHKRVADDLIGCETTINEYC